MDIMKKYGTYLSLLLGLIVVVLMFIAPALYITHPQTGANLLTDVNAFQTIFGRSNPDFSFNFLGFVALLLLVAGLAVRFVRLEKGYQYFIGAILLLLAGIFMFVYPVTIPENPATATFDSGLGFPLLTAGILLILAAIVDGVVGFLTMKEVE